MQAAFGLISKSLRSRFLSCWLMCSYSKFLRPLKRRPIVVYFLRTHIADLGLILLIVVHTFQAQQSLPPPALSTLPKCEVN